MAKHLFQIFKVGKPLCVHLFFLLCNETASIEAVLLIIVGCLMNIEQLVECELAGETQVLRENLPPPPQIPHDLTWD
jgi:hypothetical protein